MNQELLTENQVLAAELVGAARDVLNVMFFTDIVEERFASTGAAALPLQVRVTFSGDECGEFRMAVDEEAAESMAGSFLGSDPSTALSGTEVEEVMGELGNMICGAFLSRYERDGLFALSSPVLTRPAENDLPGIHRSLELMEGNMDLRVFWGKVPD